MNYEEKLKMLDSEDFFNLFFRFNAEPRWVTSAGKRAIQVLGLCHHGENHSAVFDPTTGKVNCFSECGGGMLLHTWVKRALDLDSGAEAQERIEEWIDKQDIDFENRIPSAGLNFETEYRKYSPEHIEPVEPIDKTALQEIYSKFDSTAETLSRTLWHKADGIDVDILKEYDVAYNPEHGTIILPHHNVNGDIVGIYERDFNILRREAKKKYPEMPYKSLLRFPRAKYVPLVRSEQYQTETKSSWSFPNSENVYGLHKAIEAIRKEKKVIFFEGGKSVMLARQYGFPYAVATHTFGIHVNHISIVYEAAQCKPGELEIILAFDKQYEQEMGQAWDLYESKTKKIAAKVQKFVKVSRITDHDDLIGYKDSPIDRGKSIFEQLFNKRELLTTKTKQKAAPQKVKKKRAPLDYVSFISMQNDDIEIMRSLLMDMQKIAGG